MKVTITIDSEVIKDTRDIALALIAAASNIDHGETLSVWGVTDSIMVHGQRVGTIHFKPTR